MARRVQTTAQFDRMILTLLGDDPRGDEALEGFRGEVARIPEHGMAVAGHPEFSSLPLHAEKTSILVLYTFDDEVVTLVAARAVPRTAF